jgi:DNA modification methylase
MENIYRPFHGYRTPLGQYWITSFEKWFISKYSAGLKGRVNLILTSPPFPLNRKKSYGNLNGKEYLDWLRDLSPKFRELLTEDGSLVIEIGNAWNKGEPTMSTLPIEALLAIKEAGEFYLCQEFICHNPARLPTPTQYVNVDRSSIKDSWTRIWWLSRSSKPKANNKNILIPYSKSMKTLLKKQKYNSGRRPSEHVIGEQSFLKDNGGAIPASCLTDEILNYFGSLIIAGNTKSHGDPYLKWCRENEISSHPARMQSQLARFFISFLTDEGDIVFDPFAGSNTTGAIAQIMKRNWGSVEINEENL